MQTRRPSSLDFETTPITDGTKINLTVITHLNFNVGKNILLKHIPALFIFWDISLLSFCDLRENWTAFLTHPQMQSFSRTDVMVIYYWQRDRTRMTSDASDPRVWPRRSLHLPQHGPDTKRDSPLTSWGSNLHQNAQLQREDKHPALEEISDCRKFGDMPKVKYKMY